MFKNKGDRGERGQRGDDGMPGIPGLNQQFLTQLIRSDSLIFH